MLQSPKGTRDFFPTDMAVREFIFSSWERTCRRYGFEKYDGPMFEHLELYTQKSGEEIEQQLYAFKDKAGRDLALRPEITPSLARMVASCGRSLKLPLRWYSVPTLFRYERMQKGRLREFAQLNMDIVGVAGVAADAELIAAAVAMMTDLGFGSDDFAVRVSSRTLMEDVFSALGVAPAAVPALFRLLDKRHKADEGAFMRELRGTVGDTTAGALRDVLGIQDLGEIARQFPRAGSARAIEEIFGLFGTYGVADFVTFDIGIVRGLAYYTGIVFELIDRGRTMRAIAGGGRYDTLISLYGGPETPAVGFAAGDVVLGEMCAAKGIAIPRPARSQVYVVSVGPAARDETVRTAQALRKAGISCEFSLHQAPLHKQLSLADTGRSRFAVFVGGDEAREGKVKIKDMATGNEWLVDTSTLTEELSGKTS